jgi:hypothetical protein
MTQNRLLKHHQMTDWSRKPSRRVLFPLLSRIFRNGEHPEKFEDYEVIDKEKIVNTLNYLNFMGNNILIHLGYSDSKKDILLKAYPNPCLGKELGFQWVDEEAPDISMAGYEFLHLLINHGRTMVLVPAELREVDKKALTVQLPEIGYAVEQRKLLRYACREVSVGLSQGTLTASGQLLDFNAIAFRVAIDPDSFSMFQSFNLNRSLSVRLKIEQQILFTGPCEHVRQGDVYFHEHIVLAPTQREIKRFDGGTTRNLRQQLAPPAHLDFNHPFCEKRFQGEISDISPSGFSFYENKDEGSLIPGMVIPNLTISFGSVLKMQCKAQVIYRLEEEDKGFRYGLAILDMDIDSYGRLTHLLVSSKDPCVQISNRTDMDKLWEFFFDTGFVYPKKYGQIQSKKETLKETYRKIYEDCPEIARHFIYQKSGRVYGHISMVRAYERAWLIQHQAARPMNGRPAGLAVLKHLIYYLKDLHRYPSSKMGYMMVYFRPENKFPARLFGSFAQALNNPRICSMDLFCYLSYTSRSLVTDVPKGWSLKECSAVDLRDLNRYYNNHSGGLFMDALNLGQKGIAKESLGELYDRLGFFRKCQAYSLKQGKKLKAVLILNQSDLGINLSELLNSIKVLVTSPSDLPWNILSMAIGKLTGAYNMEKVPIMFYPTDYVDANSILYEKRYQLWIYDARHVDKFMEYVKRKLRIRYE